MTLGNEHYFKYIYFNGSLIIIQNKTVNIDCEFMRHIHNYICKTNNYLCFLCDPLCDLFPFLGLLLLFFNNNSQSFRANM